MQLSLENPRVTQGVKRAWALVFLPFCLLVFIVGFLQLGWLGNSAFTKPVDKQATQATHESSLSPSSSSSLTESASKGIATKNVEISEDSGRQVTPLVVLGFTGVTWDSIDPLHTPHLWDLATRGMVANNVVKTADTTTCFAAGWLTLGAGRRAVGAENSAEKCQEDFTGVGNSPKELADFYRAANERNAFQPQLAALAKTLTAHSFSLATLGTGAQLVTLDAIEELKSINQLNTSPASSANSNPNSPSLITHYADWQTTDFAVLVQQHDLLIVDLGAVRDSRVAASEIVGSQFSAALSTPNPPSLEVQAQVRALDTKVGKILAQLPLNTAIIAVSLADIDRQFSQLQYFSYLNFSALSDTQNTAGGLASANSTRQLGLVQNTDIAPTIAKHFGINQLDFTVGAPVYLAQADDSLENKHSISYLQAKLARANNVRGVVAVFYIFWGIAVSLSLGFAVWAALSRKVTASKKVVRALKILLGIMALLPVASFIASAVPWWNLPYSKLAFLGVLLGLGALLLGVLYLFSFSLATSIALVTAVLLVFDLLLGTPLHSIAVLGVQPQAAGRFYGIANAPFVLLAVAMLYLTAKGLDYLSVRIAWWTGIVFIAGMFCLTAFVDGAPRVGADFGGPPALLVGFTWLFLRYFRKGISWRLAVGGLTIGLSAMLLISYVDWLQPVASRSHLGNFFNSVVSGEAEMVIMRKLGQVFGDMPWGVWLSLGLLLGAIFVFSRYFPRHMQSILTMLRTKFWGLLTLGEQAAGGGVCALALTGFMINDSGLVLPFTALLYGLPLWLLVIFSKSYKSDRALR